MGQSGSWMLGAAMAVACLACSSKQPAQPDCAESCIAPDHGSAACNGTECILGCDPGFNLCGSGCTPDSPASCGASCQPCPVPDHGTASCNAGTCEAGCDLGYHPCGGQCVLEDASSCGGSCAICPTPANSTATCDSGGCDFSCTAAYHLCTSQCVLEDASSCGASCAACPVPAHSTASCTGGSCDFSCSATYHLCTGQCVTENASSCGTSCAVCPVPTNSTAICTGGSCDFTCNATYHLCTGQCVTENASSCGSSCMTCTSAPANGSPVCSGGSCDYTCNAGRVRCAGGCCTVTDLQTHFYFGVARTSGGDYRAWGENTSRQLADGTTIDRPVPIAAPNIPAGTLAIAVGSDHTCFLTAAGGVKCFGSNGYGQLGDGTTTAYSATPVDVVGLASGVTSISAGYQYTCANVGGAAMCWGDNSGGKLGNGNQTLQRSPAAVSGLGSGVGQVIAGWLHTCAIVTGGGLKCWGRAEDGQLGDGVAALVSLTPVDVAGLGSGVAAAALGSYHTCALTTGGALKCWGYNGYGQLGRSTGALNLPADVTGLGSGVLALPNALGWDHTCAVVAGGGAKCWGRNDTGQIGDNTTSTRYVPVDVTGLTSGVTALTLGYQHTCALDGSGVARCWGDNSHSQLGDGTGAQRRTPVPLSTN